MARKLNRVLLSSNFCVITGREKGSCAVVDYLSKAEKLLNWYASCLRMTERHRQRRVAFRGLSFEEKDFGKCIVGMCDC